MFKILNITKKLFFALIIFLFIIFILSRGGIYAEHELKYGVTFSKKQAEELGLGWKEVYLDILKELKVKKLRIPAYWDEIEYESDKYYFDDLDWLIEKASEYNAEIILAVGGRLPRWPECHFPEWTEKLSEQERQEKILSYIEKVINRYKDEKNIVYWQVENEPFLNHFGDCPKSDKKFLDKEIALVKSLDSRPIVITDSGELSLWIPAARRADIFGTTMYRDTYSMHLKRYIHYPIQPGFFRFKKNIARLFTGPKEWIVIELQAEPWGRIPYQELTKSERDRTMNLTKFKEIIEFSSKTGFKEFYLWGVEWWYWEKEINNDNRVWEEAKGLF
ncbi:MAG: beta-galactosidase [Candidatus Falkowbacteria bacterium]